MGGVDFYEYFSPADKWITIRTLVHFAATHDWFLLHINVKNAFLHGFLHEEIYMKSPEG